MTPEQVLLVQHTAGHLQPRVVELAAGLATRLGTTDPALAVRVDGTTFLLHLLGAAAAIGSHPAMRAAAAAMNAAHDTGRWLLDVEAARPSVLASMEALVGEGWTPDVEQAWRRAYKLIVEAARSSADPSELPAQ